MLLLLAALAATYSSVAAIQCDQCQAYNGQCVQPLTSCTGMFCLYEYTQLTTGQTTMKKSCLTSSPLVVFDDGSSLTTMNQCLSKHTTTATYNVKMCNNADYCNRDCLYPQPISTGAVTCYQCSTSDGSDCTSGTCNGNYCTYVRQNHGGTVTLQKGCSERAELHLDDGSELTQMDYCIARSTGTSAYIAKICNTNYCNAQCTPDVDPDQPFNQPAVTCVACEADNVYECSGSQCQGNYCIYERRTTNGIPHVKRMCATSATILYPDNTQSNALNRCEYRTVNGVSYAVHVCNNGNNCATVCSGVAVAGSSLLSLCVAFIITMLFKN